MLACISRFQSQDSMHKLMDVNSFDTTALTLCLKYFQVERWLLSRVELNVKCSYQFAGNTILPAFTSFCVVLSDDFIMFSSAVEPFILSANQFIASLVGDKVGTEESINLVSTSRIHHLC